MWGRRPDVVHFMRDFDPKPVDGNFFTKFSPGYPSAMAYRITAVCLGNICRSPIAEAVLRDRVASAGLAELVVVDSAGTGDWHIDHPADPRAQATLTAAAYQHDHRARQINEQWMSDIDLLLAMDSTNYRDLQRMVDLSGMNPELRMLRSFDPELTHVDAPHPELDVPDPYYGGDEGFVEVLAMIERAADALIIELPARLAN
jgi:protein-tyrosine phosphatase